MTGGWYFFLMISGVLFSSMTLILWFGYRSIAESQLEADDANAVMPARLAAEPRFFAKLGHSGRPIAFDVVDDHVLADIEVYMKAEYEQAERFVAEPTVDNLYRQPNGGQRSRASVRAN